MSAFLSDGVVNLRPVTRTDLPQLVAWRNDPELRARTREFRPLTDVDQERWLAHISGPDRHDFMFVVDRIVPGFQPPIDPDESPAPRVPTRCVPIGVVGLCHWDAVNASAEVSFYVGDVRARGKGYASRAVALVCGWGFNVLRLHRIWAEVYAFNEPSIRLLERLRFRQEGTLRQHVWRQRQFVDAHLYGCLADEWIRKGETCGR